MKKFAIGLLCLTIMSCASWPDAKSEKAQMHAQVGMSLLESGNYPEALSSLHQAHDLDSDDPTIMNNLGLAYFYRGRPDKAKSFLIKALDQNEKLTDARNNLGRILLELGEYRESEIQLKMATQDLTYPRPDRPYLNLGMLYFKTSRFQEAKRSLERSLHYEKNNCTATTLLGRSYFELKDYLSSAAILDRAIGNCSFQSSDEAQYWSGMSYLKLGDLNRARRRFSEIVKLNIESPYRIEAQKQLAHERFSQ